MISEVALAMLSILTILIGVGSCIYCTILWLKISATCERVEEIHTSIITILRSKRRTR